jgi:mannose-1-phosphate guanylyltransferase
VLVWNGDILTHPPIDALLGRAAGGGLVLAVSPRSAGAGSVGLDAAGNVVRLRGETFGHEVAGGDYIGVAALGGRALAALPAHGCLIGDVALPALRRGEPIETVPHSGVWRDVGALDGYLRANLEWLERRADDCWFGEGATVAPAAEVTRSVVGARARIEGEGSVRRCVVWPDAIAVAPLADAIVTPRAVVRVESGREELD